MGAWKTFGLAADIIGVVASGISTGMTAKDIIENILDPSAGLKDAVQEISDKIGALSRKVGEGHEQQNLIALDQALQLSLQSGSRLKDFPDESLKDRKEITIDAFNGLDDVLSTSRTILDENPTPEEVLSVGTSIAYATLIQLQSAALFYDGDYMGADATTHGGDREHGGHRLSSIRDNLIEAIETLKTLENAAEEALDLTISQSTTTYYATDPSLGWSKWWTREDDKAMIEFIEFADKLASSWPLGGGGSYSSSLTTKVITTYEVSADAGADTSAITSVFDVFFGDDYRLIETFSGDMQTQTVWVPAGTSVTIPPALNGGTPKRLTSNESNQGLIADYLQKGVHQAVYASTPLDGVSAPISEMIEPMLGLVDGQKIVIADADGVLHGTRSATDQREAGTNPYLSAEGDDYISNAANLDGAVLMGYGGSDYLKGGDLTDRMYGGTGDDVYFGGAGDDFMFDDQGGFDRAIFTGDSTDYSWHVKIIDNAFSVVVSGKGPIEGSDGRGEDGIDILYGIESLTFDDKTIDLRVEDLDVPHDHYGLTALSIPEGASELYGWIGNNFLVGSEAGERLVGQEGEDTIKAMGGDDILLGNGGNDVLAGGSGNDVLDGGRGADRLTGGDGEDSFVFRTLNGDGIEVDTIGDFRSGVDKIQLDGDVFAGFGGFDASDLEFGFDPLAGLMSFWASSFGWSHLGFDAGPNIVYDNGNLYYDPSALSGDEILFARLEGNPTLTANDFEIM